MSTNTIIVVAALWLLINTTYVIGMTRKGNKRKRVIEAQATMIKKQLVLVEDVLEDNKTALELIRILTPTHTLSNNNTEL